MSGMPQPLGPNTPHLRHHHPSPAVVLRTCFSGPRCTVWQREAQLYSSECPRHTCADVCVPSHVRWACVRWLGVGAVEAPGLHVPAGQRMAGHGGHVCLRVHAPRAGPGGLRGLLPPAQLQTREGGDGLGRPQPCSPERWPGQGGRPRPGQSAGQGRGLGCGLHHVLPVLPVVTALDGRLAPIRKALPGEVGLLEAESASPRVHPNPLPFLPPGCHPAALSQGEWGDSFICPGGLSAVPQGRRTLGPLDVPPAPPGLNRCFPESPGTPGDILPKFLLP